jgi:hypothetical protein
MTLEATLERVSAIRQALADPSTLIGSGGSVTGGTEGPAGSATGESTFASALEKAAAGYESPTEGATATTASTTLEDPSATALLGASAVGDPTGASDTTGVSDTADVGATTGLASGYSSLQDLNGVAGSSAISPVDGAEESSPGARIVAIAESQLGQTEQPPGSNESPAIAQYRTATAGAVPGAPWCAYFASWVANQAGEPIGQNGQGAGAVADVWSWAQESGRAIPNGPGVVPQPGDLIVFGDEHVGIVRDVLPNGQIQTIEGNYENKVAANVRSPTEATGYVNMS